MEPELPKKVRAIGGAKTGKAAVSQARTEHIARRERSAIVELFGQLERDDSYERKFERERR